MNLPGALLLFGAALVAGAINSVAGGGSLFTFPALLATGVPAIPANATSTVAVWPGSVASAAAYREKLPRSARLLAPLITASVAGGILGATILLRTPQDLFLRLIPFLFFAATLLFAFGKTLFKRLTVPDRCAADATWREIAGVTLLQFVTAVYAGFFGGGIGILMLAFLTLLPLGDIHAMNSVKTVLGATANGVAVVVFVAAKIILWPQGVLMLIGAVAGGYSGARYAQKLNPAHVRTFVVVVGFTLSFVFLWKYR